MDDLVSARAYSAKNGRSVSGQRDVFKNGTRPIRLERPPRPAPTSARPRAAPAACNSRTVSGRECRPRPGLHTLEGFYVTRRFALADKGYLYGGAGLNLDAFAFGATRKVGTFRIDFGTFRRFFACSALAGFYCCRDSYKQRSVLRGDRTAPAAPTRPSTRPRRLNAGGDVTPPESVMCSRRTPINIFNAVILERDVRRVGDCRCASAARQDVRRSALGTPGGIHNSPTPRQTCERRWAHPEIGPQLANRKSGKVPLVSRLGQYAEPSITDFRHYIDDHGRAKGSAGEFCKSETFQCASLWRQDCANRGCEASTLLALT
ncbi:hypothetical protein EVAR_89517_1 [Eumeta japonica]|uniref:Uncharacterized protein n=1 Tax=Eumeta variegata TaxID=151549 RepID=A0A4C1Y6N9_EUMVA|nr:hypothetical protein EVAR_89517_1 [Eumeta japonica]